MIDVVKIGGSIIDAEHQLDIVLDSMIALGSSAILVHGGGRLATQMANDLGVEQRMVDGRRITDEQTLRIVTMTYAGWINKSIVAKIQARGVNAIGICGADLDIIRATRRHPQPVDYGFVGDVTSVNTEALRHLLTATAPTIVVIAPLTHDGNGTLLNTNADTIAAECSLALLPDVQLTYLFDHAGVLQDRTDERSVLARLDRTTAQELVDAGTIDSGMLPKLHNAFRAAEGGVSSVRITRYDALQEDIGTWIT
jgi:acetylglutamate kinase